MKNKVLQIRLTEDELMEFKKLAELEYEGNVSMLIRRLMRDYKEGKRDEI